MAKGLLYIYTGDGKGKTTASVGHCLRAHSSGRRVLFAQFMKRTEGGEATLLEKLSVRVIKFEQVLSPYFNPGLDPGKNRKETLRAMETLRSLMGQYDLMVLDEFNCLIGNMMVSDDEAIEFLRSRPDHLEMVLSGRGATDRLIEAADQATIMNAVKHPAARGVPARKGIEY
jgi:cob(I)alamin adenosyltransferase